MSVDLQELFRQEGYDAPRLLLDTDHIERCGRRIRTRRRVVRGTAAVVGVAALGAGTLAAGTFMSTPTTPHKPATVAAGSQTPVAADDVPPSRKNNRTTPPPALKHVSLPDPAPGFPYRRWADGVSTNGGGFVQAVDAHGKPIGPPKALPGGWAAVFGLGKRPVVEVPATAEVPLPSNEEIGPQVTIMVGDYDTPVAAAGPDVTQLPGSVTVAGVTGHFAESHDGDGGTQTILSFSTGRFLVEIVGFNGTTKDELVTLGNALQGLQ